MRTDSQVYRELKALGLTHVESTVMFPPSLPAYQIKYYMHGRDDCDETNQIRVTKCI